MKKRKEVKLEELRDRLVDVEREIVLIETNYDNITGKVNYMGREPYNIPDMFSVDITPNDLDYASFGGAMTDTDYVDEKLHKLKKEREELQKQIKVAEKELESSQRSF